MIKTERSVSKIRLIYVMTTIFMVGLSVYSFVQINNLFKSSNLIYHTTQVKNALRNISAAVMEAETNKRGFLLTRDSLLLQKRNNALHSLERAQQDLDSLISDNTGQMLKATLLYKAIEEKKKNINATSIEGVYRDVPVNLKSNIDESIQRMDKVNTLLDEMTREESLLLERRTRQFTRLSFVAPYYIIVLFLGALLILFFSYFKLNNALIKSQKLHAALVKQDEDRDTLAQKLILANQELAYQNNEKEKRASELAIANLELEFQNETKEKLAGELIVANHELAYQNLEKEKRAAELVAANKELQLFLNISSHDLQEPLRKIQMAASRIETSDYLAL